MTKEHDYAGRLRGWIGHPACPAQSVQDDLRAGADEIERLQRLLLRVLEDGDPSQDLLQEIDEAVTRPAHEPLCSPDDCKHPVLRDDHEQPQVDIYVCTSCGTKLRLLQYTVVWPDKPVAAPEASILKAFARSPRRIEPSEVAATCDWPRGQCCLLKSPPSERLDAILGDRPRPRPQIDEMGQPHLREDAQKSEGGQ
jgi:hypothetical protein